MAEENIPLRPEQIYHIYNHAVGKENLFERDANYIYFLDKLKKYILPVSDLLSSLVRAQPMLKTLHINLLFKS